MLLEHKETLEILDLDIQSDIRQLRTGFDLMTKLYILSLENILGGVLWWQKKGQSWLKSFPALK